MEKKPFLILALVLLFLAGGLVYLNLFVLKPKISQQPVSRPPTTTFRQTPPSSPTPSPSYSKEELQKVLKEGGVIPFDYEVVSVSNDRVVVTGAKGKATFSNRPTLKVYKKTGEALEEVDFSYLKVGQKLQIEKKKRPEKGITVYIVQE